MGRRTHKPEEIVAKLRQVDVLSTQGQSVLEAIRTISVTAVHLLSLAQGIRRAEERSGEAAEGSGERERAASQGGLGSNA